MTTPRTTPLLAATAVPFALTVPWHSHGRFPLTTLLYYCIFAHAPAPGQGGDEFPGTQGHRRNSQSELFPALIDAASALLPRIHDRQMAIPKLR